ncbi:MAG: hypothetical protein QOH55_1757 [Microbacteriaceae bacterium]|nr:hypothetical protein [Microbacteriaceae bacterium]
MTTEVTMRQRCPAQLVIEELLQEQSGIPPRSVLARFFGRCPLGADSVSWYRGAQGEITVGEILAQLPPEWAVFHALPVGTKGADIDHLVIGPGGIFTINTKHHGGKSVWVAGRAFMVSGHKQPHIRNAKFEAQRVTSLVWERMPLLGPAIPLIVVVNPKKLTIRDQPDPVRVMDARHLRRWLLKLPRVIPASDLAELAELFDRPETWRAVPRSAPVDLMERFVALDKEVRVAGIRSKLWALLGTAATIGVATVAGPQVVGAVLPLLLGTAH